MNVEAGMARLSYFQKFGDFFRKLFHQMSIEKMMQDAKKAEEKRREKETREGREAAKRRKEAEDARKPFAQRESKEREEAISQETTIRREEIKQKFQEFIESEARVSGSVFSDIVADTNTQDRMKNLIGDNQGVANLLYNFTKNRQDMMTDPASLINMGRSLIYEARKTGQENTVTPFVDAIKRRLDTLIPETVKVYEQDAARRYGKGFEERVIDRLSIKVDEETKQKLMGDIRGRGVDPDVLREEAIDKLLTVGTATRDISWVDRANRQTYDERDVPKSLVNGAQKVWGKVEEAERSGAHLSPEQLLNLREELLAVESSSRPTDVLPGSPEYYKAITSSDRFIRERLDALGNQLRETLKTIPKEIKQGITDPEEFIREWIKNPGRMGQLLDASPEIEDLLVGHVEPDRLEESIRFRNQVFLTIHKKILTDKHNSSNENFGLYERADFSTFQDLISSRMSHLSRDETGTTHGHTWVEWYVNLSNTLRLSRDIDFWASQPGVQIDDFAKSFSLFQNSYSAQALSIPAVEQAYRVFETVLKSIRDSNDGYIPPALIEYSGVRMSSYWDDQTLAALKRMIESGAVYDPARDKSGFHVVDDDGNIVKLGKKINIHELKKYDPQDLELQMYMTLAKGFGLASLRYLEIFANSKVPGSLQPTFGAGGFHSLAYEGPARALNYFATMIHKWKFGSVMYMNLMNIMVPNAEKKPRYMSVNEAMKAYVSYTNGTFEKDYGKDSKRFMDELNFSGQSSGFGLNYKWRQLDSTIGWSDKDRHLLGGSILIHLAEKYAEAKVKDHLVVSKYREAFRMQMASAGKEDRGVNFDKWWQQRMGQPDMKRKIEGEWEKISKHGTKDGKKVHHLVEKYTKSFKARIWLESALRNPLTVAHNLEVEVPHEVDGSPTKMRLHSLLVRKILGIPLEDSAYGVIGAAGAAYQSTPSKEQIKYMNSILGLETDIAAVRERAIEENRAITERDFDDMITSEVNREQAKQYWRLTKEALIGHEDPEHIFEELGLKMSENGTDYNVEWHEIEKIDTYLKEFDGRKVRLFDDTEIGILLNSDTVNKKWEFLNSTEDTAFRKMVISNLGPRQWVRLAGDAAAHYHGGERVGKYLSKDLNAAGDPELLAKALLEVREIYEGDAIEAGWTVTGKLAYMTSKLYGFDYWRLGSPAQLDVFGTRRGVAAWYANSRRKFLDALEHLNIIPPTHSAWGYPNVAGLRPYNIHDLRRQARADNSDVWVEIIMGGFAIAVALTLWRAFTAKDEEEEGGGHQ